MKIILLKVKDFLVNFVDYVVIISFVVFLCGVCVFFLFGIGVSNATTENRNLNALPALPDKFSLLPTYVKSFTAYFDDHVPYRNKVISFYNKIIMNTWKVSSSDQVVIGRDDWLFYTGEAGGKKQLIREYVGAEILLPDQLTLIEKYLVNTNARMKTLGKQFIVSIPPSKEEIYPEFLPSGYKRGVLTKMDQVVSILEKNDINYINAIPSLIAGKNEHTLYYKMDSHWNFYGAYIEYSNIMKELGLIPQTLEYFKIKVLEKQRLGDLGSSMLGQNDLLDDEIILGYSGATVIDPPTVPLTGFSTKNIQAPYKKRVLIKGDSFSVDFTPLVANSFEDVKFEWDYNLSSDLIKGYNPDIVILEFAERQIMGVFNSIPTTIAPQLVPVLKSETDNVSCNIEQFEDRGDSVQLRGWAYIKEQNSDSSDISLVLSSDTANYLIPMVSINRPDVTVYFGSSINYDNSGFSAVLPKKDFENGFYRLGVYVKNGNQEGLKYTGQEINILANKVTPKLVSKLKTETNNISWNLEKFNDENNFLNFYGWAYINQQSSDNYQISLVLASDKTNYLIPTVTIKRPDVTTYFKSAISYDNSGFSSTVSKKDLTKGTYRLGIYIKKGKMGALKYTDQTISIN